MKTLHRFSEKGANDKSTSGMTTVERLCAEARAYIDKKAEANAYPPTEFKPCDAKPGTCCAVQTAGVCRRFIEAMRRDVVDAIPRDAERYVSFRRKYQRYLAGFILVTSLMALIGSVASLYMDSDSMIVVWTTFGVLCLTMVAHITHLALDLGAFRVYNYGLTWPYMELTQSIWNVLVVKNERDVFNAVKLHACDWKTQYGRKNCTQECLNRQVAWIVKLRDAQEALYGTAPGRVADMANPLADETRFPYLDFLGVVVYSAVLTLSLLSHGKGNDGFVLAISTVALAAGVTIVTPMVFSFMLHVKHRRLCLKYNQQRPRSTLDGWGPCMTVVPDLDAFSNGPQCIKMASDILTSEAHYDIITMVDSDDESDVFKMAAGLRTPVFDEYSDDE